MNLHGLEEYRMTVDKVELTGQVWHDQPYTGSICEEIFTWEVERNKKGSDNPYEKLTKLNVERSILRNRLLGKQYLGYHFMRRL